MGRGLVLALGLVAGCLAAGGAFAFGAEGHRIAGRVADELLDERARATLARLAGAESLAEISVWLDEDKRELKGEIPGSDRWHYDNRPLCHADVGPGRYCADGNCASTAYARYLAVLGDARQAPSARLLALRVVVHLLEDVHQPLHVADNGDRGGNDVSVRVGRSSRPKSLHAAWDVDFVKRAVRGATEEAFAAELVARHRAELGRIAAGGFADWTAESYRLAREAAYGLLPGFACGATPAGVVALPVDYSDAAADIEREQLARAGIRLAAVLNHALAGG
jgi:hypothetical protein